MWFLSHYGRSCDVHLSAVQLRIVVFLFAIFGLLDLFQFLNSSCKLASVVCRYVIIGGEKWLWNVWASCNLVASTNMAHGMSLLFSLTDDWRIWIELWTTKVINCICWFKVILCSFASSRGISNRITETIIITVNWVKLINIYIFGLLNWLKCLLSEWIHDAWFWKEILGHNSVRYS